MTKGIKFTKKITEREVHPYIWGTEAVITIWYLLEMHRLVDTNKIMDNIIIKYNNKSNKFCFYYNTFTISRINRLL